MAVPRSRRANTRAGSAKNRETDRGPTRSESAGIVPDLLRRAMGLGFSGFFTTEELLRKALGDSVPREWAEFAAAQTDRARTELIERVARELRKALDGLDLERLLARVLETHTVEVDAKIRFTPRGTEDEPARVRVRVDREDAS